MKFRILLTGGAGFIGSNLVHYLLNQAEQELGMEIEHLVNLDKLTYAGNPDNLAGLEEDTRHQLVAGDICDEKLLKKLFREHRINAVMHLAAESHVDRSIESPIDFVMTNFVGTFQILQAAKEYAQSPEADGEEFRFLHVSTDEVYGSLASDDPAFSETNRYEPNSPYSASKAGSDHMARAFHHTFGLPVITTNCSNNYGPRQFPEKLIPLMIGKARKGEPLPVYGDGTNVRDWLYVEDHCRALAMALQKGVAGEVYNVGGKCEMKNLDVVHAIIDTVRELCPGTVPDDTEKMISFVTDRPGHDQRYAIDSRKIERELGWQPQENFASGLRKTVQWYLDNPDWIQAIEEGTYRGERLGKDA